MGCSRASQPSFCGGSSPFAANDGARARGYPSALVRRCRAAGLGGVPEWLNGAVSKTVRGRLVPRGFESLPLRFRGRNPASQLGSGRLRSSEFKVAVRRGKPLMTARDCSALQRECSAGRRTTSRPVAVSGRIRRSLAARRGGSCGTPGAARERWVTRKTHFAAARPHQVRGRRRTGRIGRLVRAPYPAGGSLRSSWSAPAVRPSRARAVARQEQRADAQVGRFSSPTALPGEGVRR